MTADVTHASYRRVDITRHLVAVVAAFAITFAVAGPALANHSSGGLHIGSMHWADSSLSEQWCVQPDGYGEGNWPTAANNIANAVYAGGSWDYRVWDPFMSGYKVDFVYAANRCDALPNRGSMWIEYRLDGDGVAVGCGAPTASCVFHLNRYNGVFGHFETGLAIVHLYGPYTTQEQLPGYYLHQVNHETGHVLGLADGTGSSDCPGSIMHSADYGCTATGYPAYPSSLDLGTEDAIIGGQP